MNPFEIAMLEVKAAAKAETERLKRQDKAMLDVARVISALYAECRWLEKDYDEERDGDPYR